MRASQCEILISIACADSCDALKRLIERETVETYKTHDKWAKTFREGGPLEWYNPPWPHNEHRHFVDTGTRESWMAKAGADFDSLICDLLKVD